MRKRGIGQDILDREDDTSAQGGGYRVAVPLLPEEAGKPGRGYIRFDGVRIQALARDLHGVGIDIGCEDLEPGIAFRGRDLLLEKHRDGVGFFAGAATSDPYAQRLAGRMIADQAGDRLVRQELENLGIAGKSS